MDELTYRTWKFRADPGLTRRIYAAGPLSAPSQCGCDPCRNFLACHDIVYPTEVLELLKQLGIEPIREAEVYDVYRDESGLHVYGGWLHFVGEMAAGPIADKPLPGGGTHITLEPIT